MLTTASNRPPLERALVSVVLPVYNEARVLPALVDCLTAALEGVVRFELIFVNDGSTDDSGTILDRLATRYSNLRVLHLSRNFGHQAAVQAGLVHANGDAVVLMDADLQDSPAAIPRFLAAWQAGHDVVYAVRTERKEAWWKRFLFKSFHRLLHAIATTPIPADAGIFGLMDRRVVREVVALLERDRYLPGLRSWVGFQQMSVTVERMARYDEKPRVSLRGLFRLAKTAIFSFSTAPLTLFHVLGAVAALLFMALGGYAIYCKLFTTLAIPGWTSYVLTASFFGALNALGISVLGEYAARIYDQVRGRPLFIVSRAVNLPKGHSTEEEKLLAATRNLVEIAAESTRETADSGQPTTAT